MRAVIFCWSSQTVKLDSGTLEVALGVEMHPCAYVFTNMYKTWDILNKQLIT